MAKANAALAKNTKPTNSHSTLHPPYFEMISEAISTLKDRTGSSQQAISKFIEDKYEKVLPPGFKKLLSVQLRKFVKSEKLVKIKNSYKISSAEKLKLAVKKTQITEKDETLKGRAAKKIVQKGMKTKKLSQVKTPEKNLNPNPNLNPKKKKKKKAAGAKMKRLSQVKTPEGLKKKKNKGSKEG